MLQTSGEHLALLACASPPTLCGSASFSGLWVVYNILSTVSVFTACLQKTSINVFVHGVGSFSDCSGTRFLPFSSFLSKHMFTPRDGSVVSGKVLVQDLRISLVFTWLMICGVGILVVNASSFPSSASCKAFLPLHFSWGERWSRKWLPGLSANTRKGSPASYWHTEGTIVLLVDLSLPTPPKETILKMGGIINFSVIEG